MYTPIIHIQTHSLTHTITLTHYTSRQWKYFKRGQIGSPVQLFYDRGHNTNACVIVTSGVPPAFITPVVDVTSIARSPDVISFHPAAVNTSVVPAVHERILRPSPIASPERASVCPASNRQAPFDPFQNLLKSWTSETKNSWRNRSLFYTPGGRI